MDHRALIASLTPGQRATLTERSDRRGFMHLAMHLGATAAVAALVVAGVPGWPAWLVPLGILIMFLFTLLHESIHRTAFRTPWINDLAALACGFLIVLPPGWFRHFHFAHHRHTQDPGNDPELAVPKPATRWQYIVHVSGLPTWWSEIRTLLRHAAGLCADPYVPEKSRDLVRREAQAMLAGYGVLAALSLMSHSAILLWIWIVPAILGQPFLRLYLLAEHGRCPLVANMLENSRTTFTNPLVRALAWNMPYHAEHHAYPAVPFHQLPELHALARAHLATTGHGYLRFNARYFASLDRPKT